MNDLIIDWNKRLGVSPFYKTHKISFGDICANRLQGIDYNCALLARHYLNADEEACGSLELIKNKIRSALGWDFNT